MPNIAPAQAPIHFQVASPGTPAATMSGALGSNTTAAGAIHLIVFYDPAIGVPNLPTDTRGSTYTLIGSPDDDLGNTSGVRQYEAHNISAGACTISVTSSTSCLYGGAAVELINVSAASDVLNAHLETEPTVAANAADGLTIAPVNTLNPAYVSAFTVNVSGSMSVPGALAGTGMDDNGTGLDFGTGKDYDRMVGFRVTSNGAQTAKFSTQIATGGPDAFLTVAAIFLEVGVGGGGGSSFPPVPEPSFVHANMNPILTR